MFNIDIETCRECGDAMKVIACIEDPGVIKKILEHLKQKGEIQEAVKLPESRPATNELIWVRKIRSRSTRMLPATPGKGRAWLAVWFERVTGPESGRFSQLSHGIR